MGPFSVIDPYAVVTLPPAPLRMSSTMGAVLPVRVLTVKLPKPVAPTLLLPRRASLLKAMFALKRVLAASRFKKPPKRSIVFVALVNTPAAALKFSLTSPEFSVSGPAKVLAPPRRKIPGPNLVTPLLPESTPLSATTPLPPPVVAA